MIYKTSLVMITQPEAPRSIARYAIYSKTDLVLSMKEHKNEADLSNFPLVLV